jgi:hypothetical protein
VGAYRSPPVSPSKPNYWGAAEPAPVPARGAPVPARQVPPKEPSIWDATSAYQFQTHYDANQQVEGVFRHFLREVPNEWREHIKLTGGGPKDKMLPRLLEYDAKLFDSYWGNFDKHHKIKTTNAWIQVQFLSHTLTITNYSIAASLRAGTANSQPKSWKLEGSPDGNHWTLLVNEKNCQRFRDQPQLLVTFPVVPVPQVPYSHFRLTQIENFAPRSALNYGEMRISAIELYGVLHKN